jgi:hypothetical protein
MGEQNAISVVRFKELTADLILTPVELRFTLLLNNMPPIEAISHLKHISRLSRHAFSPKLGRRRPQFQLIFFRPTLREAARHFGWSRVNLVADITAR